MRHLRQYKKGSFSDYHPVTCQNHQINVGYATYRIFMSEVSTLRLQRAEELTHTSTGHDIDLAEVELEEVIRSLEKIKDALADCTVLIGGTPQPPNSRLLSYVIPAVRLAHGLQQSSLCLSSTAAGGAKWNYPSSSGKVMSMTDIKLAMLEDCLREFFKLSTQIRRNTALPEESRIREFWDLAQKYAPFLCAKYEQEAHGFLNESHNHAYTDLYGVMHAVWAGDFIDEYEEMTNGDKPTIVTYGGGKEHAFNWIRAACQHIPDEDSRNIGFHKVSAPIRVVDTTYNLPVPYGEARAKLCGKYVGPIDVPLLGHETVGHMNLDFSTTGPFDVPKPDKRISKRILGDIVSAVRYIAEFNRIPFEEAVSVYVDFWRRSKDKYGAQLSKLLES